MDDRLQKASIEKVHGHIIVTYTKSIKISNRQEEAEVRSMIEFRRANNLEETREGKWVTSVADK